MTGFARSQGQFEDCSWTWEVKSVNGKALDMRCRFPHGFDSLDMRARKEISERFKRGSFSINLNIKRAGSSGRLTVTREFLDQLPELLSLIKDKAPEATPPSLDGLLGLKGVVEVEESEETEEFRLALEAAVMTSFSEALEGLQTMRATEGGQMEAVLNNQISHIADLTAQAAKTAAMRPEAIRQKLNKQIAELLESSPALSEERLNQETALLITKADIREELDRLTAHVESALELLKSDDPVGRRLDFLCQEFNREANTLCSKSSDVELTNVGLALKATIEQFREQVQNIE